MHNKLTSKERRGAMAVGVVAITAIAAGLLGDGCSRCSRLDDGRNVNSIVIETVGDSSANSGSGIERREKREKKVNHSQKSHKGSKGKKGKRGKKEESYHMRDYLNEGIEREDTTKQGVGLLER